jgi:predicted esterase
MTGRSFLLQVIVLMAMAATPWIAGAIVSCSAAAPACKGAHLANEACDLFMLARPNDAGVEPVSAPELSRFAEEHHKVRAAHIVDAGHPD